MRSAPADVELGQLVRVSAKARVLRSAPSEDNGLLVYDNQAGPDLGQMISGKQGEVISVELYRFIVNDVDFRLLAECRGECDIILEDIQVSAIDPAENRQGFVTNPLVLVPDQDDTIVVAPDSPPQ